MIDLADTQVIKQSITQTHPEWRGKEIRRELLH